MSDFDVHEAILLPVTYDDLVLMAQNINPERGVSLRDEFRKLLRERVDEAMELFDEHLEDICKAAFPDEPGELRNHPEWDSEKLEALAWEIHRWLREREMWVDVCIYYDGKCMSTDSVVDGEHVFRYNGEPFIEEDKDPRDYFEYVAEEHIISMSFEGPLYDLINYSGGKMLDEFYALFNKYGLFFELGNGWNLTCYKG